MGRRADPPELQAKKGFPGRRSGKVKAQLAAKTAAVEAEAAAPEQPAAIEAPSELAPTTGDFGTRMEPPGMLLGLPEKQRDNALRIWRELGPELERTQRLQPIHRQAFAMFCVYLAEWWEACEDLAENGRSQDVKTVAGGSMERDRPAVRWRAEAFANVVEAAKQFGLTPREEYALFKGQQEAGRDNPGLFPNTTPAPANDAAAPATSSSIGSMARLKSAPVTH